MAKHEVGSQIHTYEGDKKYVPENRPAASESSARQKSPEQDAETRDRSASRSNVSDGFIYK